MDQTTSRKIVLIAIVITPILYIILGLALIYLGEEAQISDYGLSFSILLGACLLTMIVNGFYLYKSWNLSEEIEISKRLVKDIIFMAVIQILAVLGVIYFILSFYDIL